MWRFCDYFFLFSIFFLPLSSSLLWKGIQFSHRVPFLLIEPVEENVLYGDWDGKIEAECVIIHFPVLDVVQLRIQTWEKQERKRERKKNIGELKTKRNVLGEEIID